MRNISLLLIILVCAGCYARIPEKTGLEGKSIPHYTILLADSTTYYDTQHISIGKPTVFVYFATWCVYSKAQAKEISEYMHNMKDINFYFLTTSTIQEMRKFSEDYELNKFSNVIIGQDFTNFFSDYYEVSGFPFVAIYDKNGKLVAAFEGKVSPRQIKNCLGV